jgi:hypothetical protein
MGEWDKLADYDLGRIANALEALVALAKQFLAPPAATGGQIFQLTGDSKMAITGTKVGGSSVFQVVWNGGMTPGAAVTWKADDPGISFVPGSTDPTGNTVTATDVAADTLTSYNLTVSGTASDGTAVTATAAVPLLTTPATGGTINQLS